MISDALRFAVSASSSTTLPWGAVISGRTAIGGTVPLNYRRDLPVVSVPQSQAYFWSGDWQAGELESQADLAAGRFERFETGAELLRWLHED